MPPLSASPPVHLPAALVNLPAVPSASFHVEVCQRDSQSPATQRHGWPSERYDLVMQISINKSDTSPRAIATLMQASISRHNECTLDVTEYLAKVDTTAPLTILIEVITKAQCTTRRHTATLRSPSKDSLKSTVPAAAAHAKAEARIRSETFIMINAMLWRKRFARVRHTNSVRCLYGRRQDTVSRPRLTAEVHCILLTCRTQAMDSYLIYGSLQTLGIPDECMEAAPQITLLPSRPAHGGS